MRLACPACQSIYDVPDALLGPLVPGQPGRRVRCARCAHEFTAEPALSPAEPPAEAATLSMRGEMRPSRVSRRGHAWRGTWRAGGALRGLRPSGTAVVAALWVLSFVVIGGAGEACYVWRAKVMTAWPPSQRVYIALGVR